MTIDTGVFVAGVSVLVGLDLAVLTISVQNARKVGEDSRARQLAADAEEQAQHAHTRLFRHLRDDHEKDVQTARETRDTPHAE